MPQQQHRTKTNARAYIVGYMSARCQVTSQHKLPTRDEFGHIVLSDYFGHDMMMEVLDEMIAEGVIFVYGSYLSDREIDVL